MGGEGISEYEKQRIARISENKARLEALGLPRLASSVLGSSSKQQPEARNLKKNKGKRSGRSGGGDEDDDEYRPSESDDDRAADYDNKLESSSASEEEEGDAGASSCSRRKVKNRRSLITAEVKKRPIAKKALNASDNLDDEAALRQAIALSLEATKCDSAGTPGRLSQTYSSNVAEDGEDAQRKKYKGKRQEFAAGRKKNIKLNKARVQLTEDEVVAYFFSFDETGKGYITAWDLKKMVSSHDFSWTDVEIAQMIHCFDNNGDGKLSLEDFRSIVIRCRMLHETEES